MKFTCTNLRKTQAVTYENNVLTFGTDKLEVEKLFFGPASLTSEHAEYLVVLKNDFKKKKVLHLKSPSWLVGISDDTEDEVAVEALNFETENIFVDAINCSVATQVPTRIHKTTFMSSLVFSKDEMFSMEAAYYRPLSEVDVIFCERVTSYTKTFDMTVVLKDKRVETHSCMDRKRLKEIEKWAKSDYNIGFYETGPDPLNRKDMFRCHETQSWKEINDLMNNLSSEEDEESEWEENMTDPEDETESDIDYGDETESDEYQTTDEDEDEELAFETGVKRSISDSEDDDYSESVKKQKL